ncbi:MAG: hypothetical protein KY476_01035 [Planctomycetes bacterium]|nr:hypothetical protein [Planctomycetota bacterium]
MLRSATILLVFILSQPFCGAVAHAVVVELGDGSRIVADEVEETADGAFLVLRVRGDGIEMTRRIRRALVNAVHEDSGPSHVRPVNVTLTRVPPRRGETQQPRATPWVEGVWPIELCPSRGGGSAMPPWDDCGPFAAPFIDARVIGVRDDPLAAYEFWLPELFPAGVPLSEVPFALDVLRARKLKQALLTPPPESFLPPPTPAHPPDSENAPARPAEGPGADAPPLPDTPEELPPEVFFAPTADLAGVSVAARPLRTGGGSDFDALEVLVTGRDQFGRPLPIAGTATVMLVGQRQELVRLIDSLAIADPGRLVRLASWTRTVDSRLPDSERLVLPLPRPLADHDPQLAPVGWLAVTLLVPGRGAFEADRTTVPLRHADAFRDAHTLERGTGFFAFERTHAGRRRGGLDLRVRSRLRPDSRVLAVQP